MPDDPNRPATKVELADLRAHVDQRFRQVDQRFDQVDQRFDQIDQRFDQIVEVTRDMQTEVLRAFHDWARPVELKLRTLPLIEERLGLLEERISRIERGDKHV